MGGGSGQVAFASTRLGLPQIFLVNMDGTDLVQITDMEQGACQPSWSPDGLQLVFISPCGGRGEFYDQETLNGRAILVRFLILPASPDTIRFEQSFSDDGGKTWELNWVAVDTRVADSSR